MSTMATKKVCDRCGADINPFNSVTYYVRDIIYITANRSLIL